MSLSWLFPAGFIALAALLLPLLIHLARRSEQRIIDFAALRWLSAKPRPRRRIRFDEWPLLLLRLLLLALLAVLLARPAITGISDTRARIAVLPGIDLADARRAVTDDDAQWLWLAPGFPSVEDAAPTGPQPIASLLRELDAGLPPGAPLTVVVPSVLDGLDAQRPQLSRNVGWQVLGQALPAAKPTMPAPLRLQVRHDEAGRDEVRFLRAAALALDAPAVDIATDASGFSDADAIHVWLSARPLPGAVPGRLLVDARAPLPADARRTPVWRDGGGRLVLEQVESVQGRWLRWAAPLQPASMPVLLDPAFPHQLREVLQPRTPPRRAEASAMQPGTGATAYPQPAHEPTTWLLLAIAMLFLLERWMASSRRRREHA